MAGDLYLRGVRIDRDSVPADSYVRKIRAIMGVCEIGFDRPVTFLVGENGSGKSTLLEAIAAELGYQTEGGTKNYRVSTFRDLSPLSDSITLVKGMQRPKFGYFFRAETFYNVATASLNSYMGEDYHSNSHGEGNLRFLSFEGAGLYLMDEPEAALSPSRQLTLLRHIHSMAQTGAQFLIATHSPILLGCPNATILSLDGDAVTPIAYEETECYRITKSFLTRKDLMLRELLDRETT